MKKILVLFGVLFVAGCSSPKYTYNFDYYDYNSGRKDVPHTPEPHSSAVSELPSFTASTASTPTISEVKPLKESASVAPSKKYSEMNRMEKKEFRRDVKNEIKSYIKSVKKGDVQAPAHVAQMDNDLKLAIIFGAVGLTLSLFGGINEAFWVLGVISIVVGVVFLIKWLVRQ